MRFFLFFISILNFSLHIQGFEVEVDFTEIDKLGTKCGQVLRWNYSQASPQDGTISIIHESNNKWNIRVLPNVTESYFLATLPGEYNWTYTSLSQNIQKSGTFALNKNPDFKGLIREAAHFHKSSYPSKNSPYQHRLLYHEDGTPFISVGCNICWANGKTTTEQDQKFLSYLDDFKASGGNYIRLWLASWFLPVFSQRSHIANEIATQRLHTIMKELQKRDIYVTLVIDNTHDLLHTADTTLIGSEQEEHIPLSSEIQSKRVADFFATPLRASYRHKLHYLAHHFSHYTHLLSWEFFNEADLAFKDVAGFPVHDERSYLKKWIQAASKTLDEYDPHKRAHSISFADSRYMHLSVDTPMDIIHIHDYIPILGEVQRYHQEALFPLKRLADSLRKQYKPFCFAELGHQGSNEHNPAHEIDPKGYTLHQHIWAGFMLGGHGSGMPWWWDVYIDKNELWSFYAPFAELIQHVYWRDPSLDIIRMNSDGPFQLLGWQAKRQVLLWVHIRENNWHDVLQTEQGPQYYPQRHIMLRDLAADEQYQIIWMEIGSGRYHHAQKLQSSAHGQLLLILPTDAPESIALIRSEKLSEHLTEADPHNRYISTALTTFPVETE